MSTNNRSTHTPQCCSDHTILDHVMSDLDHLVLFLEEAGFDIHNWRNYEPEYIEQAVTDFEAFQEWLLKYPQIETLMNKAQILADIIFWETYAMYKEQVTS